VTQSGIATQRDAIHAALKRQVKKWMDVMAGHNGWPYAEVPVTVVGWACGTGPSRSAPNPAATSIGSE
jgi:hypothetical protein